MASGLCPRGPPRELPRQRPPHPAWLPAGTYDSHLLHLDPAVPGAYTFGDVCDEDDDGDDVDDIDDACAETEAGAAADEVGCSLDQECPCDDGWRNHGAYVSCVSHATRDLVWLEVMTSAERSDAVSEAGQSDCGH